MKREEYIDLARRAGFEVDAEGRLCVYGSSPALMKPNYEGTLVDGMKKMVDLAIAAEREACAKVCEQDENRADDWTPDSRPGGHFANAIRARGQA
jgi:hypothetical protein